MGPFSRCTKDILTVDSDNDHRGRTTARRASRAASPLAQSVRPICEISLGAARSRAIACCRGTSLRCSSASRTRRSPFPRSPRGTSSKTPLDRDRLAKPQPPQHAAADLAPQILVLPRRPTVPARCDHKSPTTHGDNARRASAEAWTSGRLACVADLVDLDFASAARHRASRL